jgi:hypothetical protein
MKKILVLALLLGANLAWAAKTPSCHEAGTGQNVPGEVKRRLAMACAKFDSAASCDKQVKDRKLQGKARQDFLQKCEGTAQQQQRR